MMSTILKGDEAMTAGTASVGVRLAVHLVLSAAFGLIFAAVASRLRTAGGIVAADSCLRPASVGVDSARPPAKARASA